MAEVAIPKTHKAAVYDKPGELSTAIKQVETPAPGPGEVLVHLTHSGVCHSDFGVMTNSWRILPHPTQPGQVGGHEGVGKVVALGPGAELAGVKVGDRVGIKWLSAACGACGACLAHQDGACFNSKISGYYTPGTFQQYTLGPASYVTPIPDGLDSAAAAPMLCGGVTVYAALRKIEAKAGQWVVLMGAGGGLGYIAIQAAAKGFGYRVIGIDHSSKKEFALNSGAEHFFGFDTDKDIAAAVKGVTGGLGARAVLVLTASNAAYATALDYLQFGGKLVCVGIPEGDLVPIANAYPGVIAAKEILVHGSNVGNRQDAIEVLGLAARGIIKLHYREEPLEKLTEVFEEMHAGKLQGRVVIDLTK